MKGPIALAAIAFAALLPRAAHAWSEHHLLTRSAMESDTAFASREVTVTELAPLLKKLGYASVRAMNESIRIRKEYDFPPKLGEKPGLRLKALDVLAMYSDEPDWGMDKELFGPDEYPELWRDEYSMMGGKRGTPSQAFRHMYWQQFDFTRPLETFKLPLSKLREPFGEAPERARIFVDLSRRAGAAGDEYWKIRFLANALHYVQDCSQPFHTTQVPTKLFLLMPFEKMGGGFTQYVTQVTRIIAYYHYAFEGYVAKLMLASRGPGGDAEGARFNADLAPHGMPARPVAYDAAEVGSVVKAMAALGTRQAAAAANASRDFFPPITTPYLKFDPGAALTDEWWKQVIAAGRTDSEAKREYFRVVATMFVPLGQAIRDVVTAETTSLRP